MNNLRTEAEWLKAGYEILPNEVSLHLDRHGTPLWRADQTATPYVDPDLIEDEDGEETQDV